MLQIAKKFASKFVVIEHAKIAQMILSEIRNLVIFVEKRSMSTKFYHFTENKWQPACKSILKLTFINNTVSQGFDILEPFIKYYTESFLEIRLTAIQPPWAQKHFDKKFRTNNVSRPIFSLLFLKAIQCYSLRVYFSLKCSKLLLSPSDLLHIPIYRP